MSVVKFIHSAEAQILNVERFRLDKDTSNVWLGNAGLGFSLKKQKNNVYTFNGNLNLVYLSKHHSYMSLNNFKIIRQDENNLISEGYAHGRITFLRKNRISYEPFAQIQYDQGRGLSWRELYGYTFRLSLRSRHRNTLSFNTGAMYEYEKWEGTVLRYSSDSTGRLAVTKFIKSTSNLSYKTHFSDNVNFFAVVYYQARFEKFLSPRVITDLQLQLKINKHFSFNTQFVSTFDDLPIIAGNEFVYSLNNTLVIKIGE